MVDKYGPCNFWTINYIPRSGDYMEKTDMCVFAKLSLAILSLLPQDVLRSEYRES